MTEKWWGKPHPTANNIKNQNAKCKNDEIASV